MDYFEKNKLAWEYDSYEFWCKEAGFPEERAKKINTDPKAALKRYYCYFERIEGAKIANICGSCGKKAVPLALLGAEVTVFDISEQNKKYALELAQAAGTHINYEVCNILEAGSEKYGSSFDYIFMEGGILHYFHDINEFMRVMYSLLKSNGKLICSDFHPFSKIYDVLNVEQPIMSYFSKEIFEGEMPHARFYKEAKRKLFPRCSYRKYTVSEIINSVINNGFELLRFDEHPSWENDKLPGEFTITAKKSAKTEQGKCGFDCALCPTYKNCDCKGCMEEHKTGDCCARDCAISKNAEHCLLCCEFPCELLLTQPHTTVLDKDWLKWKQNSE